MMQLEKFSMGVGDRFGHQGQAQLAAMQALKAEKGVVVVPVWNKSYREHQIIGTEPAAVRVEADAAVKALGWKEGYHVDADHINLKIVAPFIEPSDFFTLDVADAIGEPADVADVDTFLAKHPELQGTLLIEGISRELVVSEAEARKIAETYLLAVKEAAALYRHIESKLGAGNFVTEVSMDETELPQSPIEMLFILAALADEGVPAQTIAPKFSGRFNKGVEYVGDASAFRNEFEEDLLVIAHAVTAYDLPANLKLSVHSGSDKFAIYAPIAEMLKKYGAGLHLKTAGTTWLEELIGLAAAGGSGLEIAKEVYRKAFDRFDELCGPYATVIDIDQANLPTPDVVDGWDEKTYAETLRHDASNANYNLDVRQLLHVGYKVASEMGERYLSALVEHEESVAQNVTENLLERHLRVIFGECKA